MLHRISSLLALLVLATVASFASITVQSPADGSTVANPVHVVAADPNATHMKIYVDYKEAFDTSEKTIDTLLTLTPGSHRLVVQSWTWTGLVSKVPLYITVPEYANVVSNLEETIPWKNCGTCGNSAGNTNYVTGTQTLVDTPALKAPATVFSVEGTSPYTNFYWYLKTWDNRTISKLRNEFDIYIPAQYAASPQAIEFESQHKYNGYVYNFAMQFGYKNGLFRTFDKVNRKWVSTGIPFSPTLLAPDMWHHVASEFTVDYVAHTRTLVAWYVDGVKYIPSQNVTLPALPETGTNYTAYAAFQLDMDKYADNYSVVLDNYTFSWQP